LACSAGSEVSRWVLTLFSAAVVIGLAVWARKAVKPMLAAGIGLIIGGAFGNNLIDRVRYGYVVDFIDVERLHFPWVFNVADSAITVGVACCCWTASSAKKKSWPIPTVTGCSA
jgi:signal peptidase II